MTTAAAPQRRIISLAPLPTQRSRLAVILVAMWNEWMGDGPVLGRGNFAEFMWANLGNLQIGLLIVLFPANAVHSHGLALMLWRWPRLAVAAVFIASALATDAGLVLSLMRGRCVASRIARLIGSASGAGVWVCLLGSVWMEANWSDLAWSTAWIGVIVYARCACLAWRRF